VVGTAPGETYLASDVPAFLDKASAFYAVNDDEIVRLGPEGFSRPSTSKARRFASDNSPLTGT